MMGMRFTIDTANIRDDYRTVLEGQMFKAVETECRRIARDSDDEELREAGRRAAKSLAILRRRWLGQ